jgi:hypothetical protein
MLANNNHYNLSFEGEAYTRFVTLDRVKKGTISFFNKNLFKF